MEQRMRERRENDRGKGRMNKNKPLIKVSKEREKEIKDKWIYNISARTLNKSETSILQRGLAFTPSQPSPNVVDFIAAIEDGARLLGAETAEAASLRSNGTRLMQRFRPAPPNITAEERLAIKSIQPIKGGRR